MALLSSLKQIAGIESTQSSKEFMAEFVKIVLGTLSLPINLPNTNYHLGLQVNPLSLLSFHMLGSILSKKRLNCWYYGAGKEENC